MRPSLISADERLIELGFGIPEWLRLVPADFEAGDCWWERLKIAGFDGDQPAVVASADSGSGRTGVLLARLVTNIQMILPPADIVGLLQAGVGNLLRQAGLDLMRLEQH